MSIVEDELTSLSEEVREIAGTELITCHRSLVMVRLRHTDYKQLTMRCQFPVTYPSSPLLVELSSKTIEERVLNGLVNVCEQELKKRLGQKQVAFLIKFVSDFLACNPFTVCPEELAYIKKELYRDGDQLRVRQKAGIIDYTTYQGRYFMEVKLTVPHHYPATAVQFVLKDTNFPLYLVQVFRGHVSELCRQCVEPPLRRKNTDPPFEPKPSLKAVTDSLVLDCVRRYPEEECPMCRQRALPQDPAEVRLDETHPQYAYRVYCGHMYHRKCLETHMKTPPFAGGKKCLKCNQRIFHEKWNIPPKLAEDRWAHQEARKREIAEVSDFLGF